jgi:hypothetical protein
MIMDVALVLGIPSIVVILSKLHVNICSRIMLKGGNCSVYPTGQPVLDFRGLWLRTIHQQYLRWYCLGLRTSGSSFIRVRILFKSVHPLLFSSALTMIDLVSYISPNHPCSLQELLRDR